MTWKWPFGDKPGREHFVSIPISDDRDDHDGAFAHRRRFDYHTGVDLYCDPGQPVYAVEDGVITNHEIFTGPHAGSPWWLETYALLVEGRSGTVLYGEIMPRKLSGTVKAGELIGYVMQVRRTDIWARLRRWWHGRFSKKPLTMLHLELYGPGQKNGVWWQHDEPRPSNLRDPTADLLDAQLEAYTRNSYPSCRTYSGNT